MVVGQRTNTLVVRAGAVTAVVRGVAVLAVVNVDCSVLGNEISGIETFVLCKFGAPSIAHPATA